MKTGRNAENLPKLNVVGCGHVGRVLARLFTEHHVFQVQDIVNRSQGSSAAALIFVGAGRALDSLHDLRRAKFWMLAVADDQIPVVCQQLLDLGKLRAGDILFHCSGALASNQRPPLQAAQKQGVLLASVHPVRSFADPVHVAQQFGGTFCSIEGDPAACQALIPALQAIGGQTLQIDGAHKSLYHAASVFACNYLTSLLDVALRTGSAAGIPPPQARALLEPLVRETLDNIFRLGPAKALTGPLARGDLQTVARQQQALQEFDTGIADLYRAFTAVSAQLVVRKQQGVD